ncbi:MAG: HNH endonuclease signature motif containing protein [Pseudomonadota bacterium]|nr:HNH endonuclease signature motif containing protein [Pseudomonadota bacterium]
MRSLYTTTQEPALVAGFVMPRAPGSLAVPATGPSRIERERERKRWFDEGRGSSAARGYDSRWRRTRIGWLGKHPLCVMCELKGLTVAASRVDHIVPHRGCKVLFWDRNNWQSLCEPCHNSKTAREDSAFTRVPPV